MSHGIPIPFKTTPRNARIFLMRNGRALGLIEDRQEPGSERSGP